MVVVIIAAVVASSCCVRLIINVPSLPLEEKLGKEVKRLSKVPIRNVKDVYNVLTDRETLYKVLEQGLGNEEYQRHRDEIVNLFMGLKEKDKIKVEDLTLYEPIFTLNIQKSKCSICQEFAIFIVLTVIIVSSGFMC